MARRLVRERRLSAISDLFNDDDDGSFDRFDRNQRRDSDRSARERDDGSDGASIASRGQHETRDALKLAARRQPLQRNERNPSGSTYHRHTYNNI